MYSRKKVDIDSKYDRRKESDQHWLFVSRWVSRGGGTQSNVLRTKNDESADLQQAHPRHVEEKNTLKLQVASQWTRITKGTGE